MSPLLTQTAKPWQMTMVSDLRSLLEKGLESLRIGIRGTKTNSVFSLYQVLGQLSNMCRCTLVLEFQKSFLKYSNKNSGKALNTNTESLSFII